MREFLTVPDQVEQQVSDEIKTAQKPLVLLSKQPARAQVYLATIAGGLLVLGLLASVIYNKLTEDERIQKSLRPLENPPSVTYTASYDYSQSEPSWGTAIKEALADLGKMKDG